MEIRELFHAQDCFDFTFNFFYDPWNRRPVDDPFGFIIVILIIVDAEFDFQLFSFSGIEINLLPSETVNIGVIDSDYKIVFWLVLVVDLHFLERMYTV